MVFRLQRRYICKRLDEEANRVLSSSLFIPLFTGSNTARKGAIGSTNNPWG